jgi:hypothetical protein
MISYLVEASSEQLKTLSVEDVDRFFGFSDDDDNPVLTFAVFPGTEVFTFNLEFAFPKSEFFDEGTVRSFDGLEVGVESVLFLGTEAAESMFGFELSDIDWFRSESRSEVDWFRSESRSEADWFRSESRSEVDWFRSESRSEVDWFRSGPRSAVCLKMEADKTNRFRSFKVFNLNIVFKEEEEDLSWKWKLLERIIIN